MDLGMKQKDAERARVEKDVLVWKRREWYKVEEKARMERDVIVW